MLNQSLTKKFKVEDKHSAKNMGSGDLDVLSTPMLVAFMEETSKDLLNKHIEDEFGSVGSNININHIAPTKVGAEVEITSEIIEIIKEKIINFKITAFEISNNEQKKEIGNATHTRVIINNEKFLEKIK